MPIITIIGGGSGKFVRELVVDFFSFEALHHVELRLMDIDQQRVERSERLVKKIIADRKLPAKVWSTTDRRAALDGADYVIVTIMAGGFDRYHADVAIPAEYGIYQAVSDTTGPGAVMRILRTAPVLRGIAADLAELAPSAWLLNYANPMAMNIWTLLDAGHQRTVGLCHSIQGFLYWHMQHWLEVPLEKLRYEAAGINHVNFYLRLEDDQGNDLYPKLREAKPRVLEKDPKEKVRFELLEHLGYFPAEGPGHQTEYYPWFHKNQAAVDEYAVGAFFGYNIDLQHFKDRTAELDAQIAGEKEIWMQRSPEYGAPIIHAMETNQPLLIYGNVRNEGLIDSLPRQAVVEVPCVVDGNGLFPCRMGTIPPQLAAVMSPHVHLQELAVRASQERDPELVRLAIAADPLAGAILTLPKLREMTDRLLANNAEWIADWPRKTS